MKYMLLIYSKEDAWTESEWIACVQQSTEICHELAAKGQFISASPLHSINTATSVRIRDGKRLITDGPFAETSEQLGGYFLVDVPHLDEALQIASRLPGAQRGSVEVRPVFEAANLPASPLS